MAREFAKDFYNSKQWKECRKGYKRLVHGLCERCGKPGDIVHHKIKLTPYNINNPEITLNWDNLELLCIDCHNREHMLKYGPTREDVMFSEDGDLVPSPLFEIDRAVVGDRAEGVRITHRFFYKGVWYKK